MNRDSNSYTFIYASGLVILVAALLALAAVLLKPFQDKNIEVAKKSDILKSVLIESDASTAVDLYSKYIVDTYIVNSNGEKVSSDKNAFDVDLKEELAKPVAERLLPVFQAKMDDGSVKYIIAVRGQGLWGPIWGYIAMNEDKETIYGAMFDHEGETPGLGAEIAKAPFQEQFKGKKIFKGSNVDFTVAKGGATPGDKYAVDAISGGTLTSKGVEAMLLENFNAYSAFFKK